MDARTIWIRYSHNAFGPVRTFHQIAFMGARRAPHTIVLGGLSQRSSHLYLVLLAIVTTNTAKRCVQSLKITRGLAALSSRSGDEQRRTMAEKGSAAGG